MIIHCTALSGGPLGVVEGEEKEGEGRSFHDEKVLSLNYLSILPFQASLDSIIFFIFNLFCSRQSNGDGEDEVIAPYVP